MKTLTIFVSSPGDVRAERTLVGQVIERLQARYWNFIRLEPILWEREPLRAIAHFNEEIIRPSDCDIFICILWSRLGSPMPKQFRKADGGGFESGTEWELIDAVNAFEARAREVGSQAARPQILVYRRTSKRLEEDRLEKESEARNQQAKLEAFEKEFFFEGDTAKRARRNYQSLAEFEEVFEEQCEKLVRRELTAITEAGEIELVPWEGSPFKGLKAFGIGDAPLFFGRFRAIEQVLRRLKRQRELGHGFVLIYGGSGFGKSSLMYAGVAARLTEPGYIKSARVWRCVSLFPGRGDGNLCERLARTLMQPEDGLPEVGGMPYRNPLDSEAGEEGFWDTARLARWLEEEPAFCLDPIDRALDAISAAEPERGGQTHFCLLLDQLEEVFTREDISPAQRDGFFGALAALSTRDCIWIVSTMRSEYFSEIAKHEDLRLLTADQGGYILEKPRLSELNQMIRFPPLAAGLEFEKSPETGDSLSTALYEEMKSDPGALPLLQFALEQLYEQRVEPDGSAPRLTWKAYQEMEGLRGAIGVTAGEAFEALSASEQGAAEHCFGELVTVSGLSDQPHASRRLADYGDLVENIPNASGFLDRFMETKLLVTDADPGSGRKTISLAHEALMTHWPKLDDWVSRHEDLLRARARLAESTRLFCDSDTKKEKQRLLLTEARLAEAEAVRGSGFFQLEPAEKDFVERSRRRTRARLRFAQAAALIFGITAVVAILAGFVARHQKQQAIDTLSASHFDKGLELLEAGKRYQSYPWFAKASELRPENPAYGSMIWSLLTTEMPVLPVWTSPGRPSQTTSAVVDASRERLLICSAVQPGRLFNLKTGEEIASWPGASSALMYGNFSPRGDRVILGMDADLKLRVWNGPPFGSEPELSIPPLMPLEHLVITGDDQFAAWSSGKLLARMGASSAMGDWPVVFARIGQSEPSSTDVPFSMIEVSAAAIRVMAAHPLKPLIAIGADDGTAALWDLVKEERLFEWEFEDSVESAEFSRDGRLLAFGSYDNHMRIVSTETGEVFHKEKLTHDINDVTFSGTGRFVAGAVEGVNGTGWSRVWYPDAPLSASQWMKLESFCVDVDFGPEDGTLLTVSEEGIAEVWDWPRQQRTQKIFHRDASHGWVVNGGNRILTVDTQAGARLWPRKESRGFLEMPHTGEVRAAQLSDDGRTLLTTTSSPTAHQLWDITTGLPVHQPVEHQSEILFAFPAPGGTGALIGLKNGSGVVVNRAGAVCETWKRSLIHSLENSPDAIKMMAVFEAMISATAASDGPWLAESIPTLGSGLIEAIQAIEASDKPPAELMEEAMEAAANSVKGTLRIHRVTTVSGDDPTLSLVREYPVGRHFLALSIGNRGDLLAGLTIDTGSLYLSRRDGKEWGDLRKIPIHQTQDSASEIGHTKLLAAKMSPRILLANNSTVLTLCDFSTDPPTVLSLSGLTSSPEEIAISPGGDFVAACQSSTDDASLVGVWDASTGALLHRISVHDDDVNSLVFSPDSRFLLTSSDDKSARLWEVQSGKSASAPLSHAGWVRSAIFDSEGLSLFTASDDKTVRRYSLMPAGKKAPDWAKRLVESIGEVRIDETGRSIAVSTAERISLGKELSRMDEGSSAWDRLRSAIVDPSAAGIFFGSKPDSLAADQLRIARIHWKAGQKLEALHALQAARRIDREIEPPEFFRFLNDVLAAGPGLAHIDETERAAGTVWTNGYGMRFRWCPPGSFRMGTAIESEFFRTDEMPHAVVLTRGFWISETEVTQAQLESITNVPNANRIESALSDPSKFKVNGKEVTKAEAFGRLGNGFDYQDFTGFFGPDKPAILVSATSAELSCQFMTIAERESGKITAAQHYRLPTEAEWEYACRAGTAGSTWLGEPEILGKSNSPTLDGIAWYGGNSSEGFEGIGQNVESWVERSFQGKIAGPRKVGGRSSNPWGLLDMLGGVKEWCADGYSETYGGGEKIVPLWSIDSRVPASDQPRVAKGGSWRTKVSGTHAGKRYRISPDWEANDYGFRVVLAEEVN